MGDLKSPRVICAKGLLFLGVGLLASTLLILEAPRVKTALFLVLPIWAFCRFYYFAFYVIEHYVDSDELLGRQRCAGYSSVGRTTSPRSWASPPSFS